MDSSTRGRATGTNRAQQERMLAEWNKSRLSGVDFVELTVGPKVSSSATTPRNVHLRDGIRVEVADPAQLDWVAALSQRLEDH